MVVFICVLGGIGTAGVPAGSLPVIVYVPVFELAGTVK
jgi:Na+/H+-dicarboxylate symporter